MARLLAGCRAFRPHSTGTTWTRRRRQRSTSASSWTPCPTCAASSTRAAGAAAWGWVLLCPLIGRQRRQWQAMAMLCLLWQPCTPLHVVLLLHTPSTIHTVASFTCPLTPCVLLLCGGLFGHLQRPHMQHPGPAGGALHQCSGAGGQRAAHAAAAAPAEHPGGAAGLDGVHCRGGAARQAHQQQHREPGCH